MLETDKRLLKLSNKVRKKSSKSETLENGETNKKALKYVNETSKILNESVYEKNQ